MILLSFKSKNPSKHRILFLYKQVLNKKTFTRQIVVLISTFLFIKMVSKALDVKIKNKKLSKCTNFNY